MKKLMILSTILLLGISSVFAQGAYDVVVPWDISNSDCQVVDQVNDRFVVFITIYDDANGIIVVDNAYNIEDNDADESTFDVQTEVQAHCNDGSLNNTPNFIIYAKVRLVYMPTPSVYCSQKSTNSGYDCSDFSNGYIEIPTLVFD